MRSRCHKRLLQVPEVHSRPVSGRADGYREHLAAPLLHVRFGSDNCSSSLSRNFNQHLVFDHYTYSSFLLLFRDSAKLVRAKVVVGGSWLVTDSNNNQRSEAKADPSSSSTTTTSRTVFSRPLSGANPASGVTSRDVREWARGQAAVGDEARSAIRGS